MPDLPPSCIGHPRAFGSRGPPDLRNPQQALTAVLGAAEADALSPLTASREALATLHLWPAHCASDCALPQTWLGASRCSVKSTSRTAIRCAGPRTRRRGCPLAGSSQHGLPSAQDSSPGTWHSASRGPAQPRAPGPAHSACPPETSSAFRCLSWPRKSEAAARAPASLEAALAEARARDAPAALEVVSLNRHAVSLYQARGWREIGSVSYDWLPDHARSLLFVPPAP